MGQSRPIHCSIKNLLQRHQQRAEIPWLKFNELRPGDSRVDRKKWKENVVLPFPVKNFTISSLHFLPTYILRQAMLSHVVCAIGNGLNSLNGWEPCGKLIPSLANERTIPRTIKKAAEVVCNGRQVTLKWKVIELDISHHRRWRVDALGVHRNRRDVPVAYETESLLNPASSDRHGARDKSCNLWLNNARRAARIGSGNRSLLVINCYEILEAFPGREI